MKRIFIYILLCGLITPIHSATSFPDNNNPAVAYLVKGIVDLDKSISESKQELYSLKMNWYNICVRYLQKDPNSFKKEDLESLINQTVEDIDGKELIDELSKALKEMKNYHYSPVPTPTLFAESQSQKNGKKTPSSNSQQKKGNKETEPSIPKDGKIEEDPTKDKPGNDKVVDNDKKENMEDTPPIDVPLVPTTTKDNSDGKDPAVSTPQKKDNTGTKEDKPEIKQPKKNDRGSIEEGKSKVSKQKDGGIK